MDLVERAHEELDEQLNSEGRSLAHVALGGALCVGAVAVSVLLASRASARSRMGAPTAPPDSPLKLLAPALFSMTTLAALRIWNAPASPQRTKALGLWGAVQALNGAWTALGPRDRMGQVAAALSTAGLTALYAHEAGKVDLRAGGMAAPLGGLAGFANLFGGELGRRRPSGTVH